jgi:hypothetical protein
MFMHSQLPNSAWAMVESNDKKRAPLNCISHFLNNLPYDDKEVNLSDKIDPKFIYEPPLAVFSRRKKATH